MDGLRIGEAARPLTPLTSEDTLARAAEILRSVPFDMVPVVAGDRLIGVVTARALADAARAEVESSTPAADTRARRLDDGLVTWVTPLPAEGSMHEASRALGWSANSLPVVDAGGRYVGMLSRADVVAAAWQGEHPPSMGGMATPLGVYLTTGTASAGALGSLGLMLTGAGITLLFMAAAALTGYVALGIQQVTGIPVLAAKHSVPIADIHLNRYDIWPHALPLLWATIAAGLLKLSPLAGYHAAEHQVVHAVERSRPLTPESVAEMPRAHPRCGTRLIALFALFFLCWSVMPVGARAMQLEDSLLRAIVAVVVILVWWRPFSMRLQDWVTTRPASRRQLRSAIAAAEGLLEKHRERPRAMALWSRIWYMGVLQVMAGGFLAQLVLVPLVLRLGLPVLW